MGVEMKVYKGLTEIERNISIPEWESMFLLSSSATVFNHPLFVLDWFKTSNLRNTVPVLIIGESGKRTIIFPMELYKKRYWAYEQNVLYAMGGLVHFDFQDPLISGGSLTPTENETFWEELFRVIRREIPECDQIVVPRLRPSVVAGVNNCEQSTVSPYIDLSDCTNLDDVLAKCKKSHRGDVKRQIKRLGEKNPVTMRVFLANEKRDAREELTKLFEAWERQWERKWPEKGAQDFYYHLIDDMLETGFIHFSVLKCGDEPIHWHFGFLYDSRLHWFKTTLNVTWKNYSPGKVHVALLIEECIKNRVRFFDFLYGDEAYKYDWAPIDEKLYGIRKWNGLRPMPRFVEEIVKPSYRFMRYRCLKDIQNLINGKRLEHE